MSEQRYEAETDERPHHNQEQYYNNVTTMKTGLYIVVKSLMLPIRKISFMNNHEATLPPSSTLLLRAQVMSERHAGKPSEL